MNSNEKSVRSGAPGGENKSVPKDSAAMADGSRAEERAVTHTAPNYRSINLEKARATKRKQPSSPVESSQPKRQHVEISQPEEDDGHEAADDDDETENGGHRQLSTSNIQSPGLSNLSGSNPSFLSTTLRTVLSAALFTAGAVGVQLSSVFLKSAIEHKIGLKSQPNKWIL